MSDRVAIKYTGFWDVPRIFLTRYRGQTFLFDCAFDKALDDYPDTYKVFLLPHLRDEELPKDWTTLPTKTTQHLGEVPIVQVEFDASLRQSIGTAILDELLARKAIAR